MIDKRGRPKKEISRKNVIKARLNDEELGMALEISRLTDKSLSEIMRIAIRCYYNLLDNIE